MSLEIISPITGEKIQVAFQDLSEMKWVQAKKACANLGKGWRLPTLEELQVMYKELHLKGRGDFCPYWYWSGTEHSASFAWNVSFANGDTGLNDKDKYSYRVRAVRTLK